MKRNHAMPQNLHILPKGKSVSRACGATAGGFVRERDAAWLKKFLRNGGGLCPECAKTPECARMLGKEREVRT